MSIYYQKSPTDADIMEIEIYKISPNPNQPRKSFSSDAILKLASSIREYGIIQPLVVRKIPDGYELIAGERRLRAAKELGMSAVPCIVSQISDEKSAEVSIVENLIREDLNIFEEAMAIENLIDSYGLTQEQLAKRLSNSQSYIANKLRLLRLSKNEQELILENGLTERHARALLRIHDEELRLDTLNKIISDGLNVSRSEELVEGVLARFYPKSEQLLQKSEIVPKNAPKKSVGSFYSTIERAIESYKESGANISSRKIENDDYTEITIVIGTQRVATK